MLLHRAVSQGSIDPTIVNDLARTLAGATFLKTIEDVSNKRANLVARSPAPMFEDVRFHSTALRD